jgi:hypothetical protein
MAKQNAVWCRGRLKLSGEMSHRKTESQNRKCTKLQLHVDLFVLHVINSITYYMEQSLREVASGSIG